MKKQLFKFLKVALPLAFGVFVIWYFYYNTSQEHQQSILKYIKEANYGWVALSLLCGLLSHASRAHRWNYLLQPLGYKPKFRNNFMAVLAAYLANLGIPRSGEILRASLTASYDGVPFEKGFGTIMAERVIDLFMLIVVICVALIFQTDTILGFLTEKGFNSWSLLIVAIAGIAIAFIGWKIISKSTSKFAQKLKQFVVGLWQGVTSILHMQHKWLFILHTLFIWAMYLAMFWVVTFTVPELSSLSLSAILTAFIAGSFAITATNGGIGVFPVAVSKTLALYGITAASGDAFGWIMWISQTLMILLFGALSLIFLPILNRKK